MPGRRSCEGIGVSCDLATDLDIDVVNVERRLRHWYRNGVGPSILRPCVLLTAPSS